MGPISILLCGMAVVIGGVLVLRLHAFLALILGALAVAALTPAATIFQSEIVSAGFRVAEIEAAGAETIGYVVASPERQLSAGSYAFFRRERTDAPWKQIGEVNLRAPGEPSERTRVVIEARPGDEPPQAGDLLVRAGDVKAATAAMKKPLGDRIAVGFGSTCLSIGILIAMATIVGSCLLDSGAAERVVVAIRRLAGDERAPWAFLVSGFIVAIPVFFDTVFFLLMPLGKAMRIRSGKNYLLYVLSIVAGGTMAHSLVPPTPGPLFVASELGVSIGAMILGGIVVGGIAALSGYAYAAWANRRWEIPLRASAELTQEELQAMAQRDETTLPPLWLSAAPILLPVVFIAVKSVLDFRYEDVAAADIPSGIVALRAVFDMLGNKNIALIVAAALALFTLAWHMGASRAEIATAVQGSLSGGAVIILITAAGGAFGQVLRQTNISGAIQDAVPPSQAGITLLLIAFFVTAVVRVAQGSATVAMITGVGIVAPLAATMSLPYHPLYLALAVGCGSKPLPWMNDSGFWVVGRMSGLTEAEMLKTVTVMLTVMGITGMAITLLGAWLFPLV